MTQDSEPKTGNQNLDLLIKLLNMTTSDNDNIALMAARKANAQLTKFNATWESLLRSRVTVVADPFGPIAEPRVAATVAPSAAKAPVQRAPQATPPPRPSAPPRSAPPPRPVQPAPAAQPPDPDRHLRMTPNRFDAKCCKCQRTVPAGKGLLISKSSISGKWQVECALDFGHNAKDLKTQPKRPAKMGVDDLLDQI